MVKAKSRNMKTFKVKLACMVPATALVTVKAASQDAADRKVLKSIGKDEWDSIYWKVAMFTPDYTQAEDLDVLPNYDI